MTTSNRTWWLGLSACGLLLTAAGVDLALAQDGGDGDEKKVLEVGKWYPTLEGGLQLTQSSYSDNWSGGDKGSIVWTAIVNGTAENQIKPKINWNNTLKLAYGQTHQQSVGPNGERAWDRPEKSTDLIDYETIFRFTLGGVVDPFLAGRFESQFQDATDPAGRTLAINPMKFKETAGVAKVFLDEEDLNLITRLGFSFRQNLRKQFVVQPTSENPFPTDTTTDSEFTNDGGLEFVLDYKNKILEDKVTYTSKFTAFQPVFYSASDDFDMLLDALNFATSGIDPDIKDFTTVADLDWENIFSTQITKIVSVNLYLRWLYDKYDNSVVPVFNEDGTVKNASDLRVATRKAGQFKQTMAIGFTYRFL